MSYITTFSKSVTGKLPYHFICSQCGQLCEKQLEVNGFGSLSVKGYVQETPDSPALEVKLATAAMNDLKEKTAKIQTDFEAYRAALNAPSGSKPEKGKAAPPRYLPMDGKCGHCGHKQFWAIDPDEAGLKPGCLVLSLSVVGAGVFLAALSAKGAAQTILGISSFVIVAGSVVGFFLVHNSSIKKEEARISAMPHGGGLPAFGEVLLSDDK